MKKWVVVILCLILCASAVCYATQTILLGFSWDANTEPDLAGYRLYSSQASGSYTFGDANSYISIDPNSTAYLLGPSPAIETYFVLTAIDTAGNESEPSNEVKFDPVAPSPPGNFKIEIIVETSH